MWRALPWGTSGPPLHQRARRPPPEGSYPRQHVGQGCVRLSQASVGRARVAGASSRARGAAPALGQGQHDAGERDRQTVFVVRLQNLGDDGDEKDDEAEGAHPLRCNGSRRWRPDRLAVAPDAGARRPTRATTSATASRWWPPASRRTTRAFPRGRRGQHQHRLASGHRRGRPRRSPGSAGSRSMRYPYPWQPHRLRTHHAGRVLATCKTQRTAVAGQHQPTGQAVEPGGSAGGTSTRWVHRWPKTIDLRQRCATACYSPWIALTYCCPAW